MKDDKDGLEYMEINGVASRVNRGGNFGSVAQMGQVTRTKGEFDRRIKYGERLPLGAADPKERIQRLDKEGLEGGDHLSEPRPDLGNRMRGRRLRAGDDAGV